MSLTVGETVIHPHHGAARVDQLESRRVGNEDIEYVVLESPFNDLTVRVPVAKVDDIGIRPCMSMTVLDEVLGVLRDAPTKQKGHWSRRLKRNQTRMRSGQPTELAMVVRDLTSKLARKGLSPAERRLHRSARRMLHAEMAAILDGGDQAAEDMLQTALVDHLHPEEDADTP